MEQPTIDYWLSTDARAYIPTLWMVILKKMEVVCNKCEVGSVR